MSAATSSAGSAQPSSTTVLLPRIESRIQTIRGLWVMVDADLAALYGVETKRLNEQVKRNASRFPADFMFQLTAVEKAEVVANCDHLQKLKFSKALPFVFTEYGAVALANVLASAQAVEMGIYVVRAFVQLRHAASLHADLNKRLTELELSTERLQISHDLFSRNTRIQLKQVMNAIEQLMIPPNPPKRPIGFITPQDLAKESAKDEDSAAKAGEAAAGEAARPKAGTARGRK